MAQTTRSKPIVRAVLRGQPDDRLVKLARQGRELAFEEIVRRYRPGLVVFANAYAPSDRAEDVVQESLLSSWDALRDSSSEIRLKPWLYTIVRNRALNARRDAKLHQPLDEAIDGVRQPSEIALSNEELRNVVAAVGALPNSQRTALVRSSLEGHTHEQIAETLETSPGAVRQLIFRARTSLRAGLGAFVPLPVVAALAGGGGSGAAGAVAAGTAASAGGGGSLATTGATVAAVAAIAAGGGIAVDRSVSSGELAKQPGVKQEERAGDRSRDFSEIAARAPAGAGDDLESGGSAGSGSDDGPGGGDRRDGERVEAARGDSRDDADHGDGDDARDAAEDDARETAEAEEEAREVEQEAREEAREEAEEAAEQDSDHSGSSSEPSASDSSGSGSSGSGSAGSGSSGSGSVPDPEALLEPAHD